MSEDETDRELEARGPLDLSPWQPPPAPAGVVDAAVRAARPSGGERTLIVRPRAARGAMLAAAALATSVLALAGVVYLKLQPEPEPPPTTVATVDTPVTDYAPELGSLEARMRRLESQLAVPPANPPPALIPPIGHMPPPPISAMPVDPNAPRGTLRISSKPQATIFIDGTRLGITPFSGSLTVGKHKLTFGIGEDRYSFWVTIKPGEETIVTKDFGI